MQMNGMRHGHHAHHPHSAHAHSTHAATHHPAPHHAMAHAAHMAAAGLVEDVDELHCVHGNAFARLNVVAIGGAIQQHAHMPRRYGDRDGIAEIGDVLILVAHDL